MTTPEQRAALIAVGEEAIALHESGKTYREISEVLVGVSGRKVSIARIRQYVKKARFHRGWG